MAGAALFRVEGVLVGQPTVVSVAKLATSAQTLRDRAFGLAPVALSLPFTALAQLRDVSTAGRMQALAFRDMSTDRIDELGRQLGSSLAESSLTTVARGLIDSAGSRGERIVLVSDGFGAYVRPFARALGIDERDVIAHELEVRQGRGTGRVVDEAAPYASLPALRRFADARGFTLADSTAYGSNEHDVVLLSAVRHACVVHPSYALRAIARTNGWPCIERGSNTAPSVPSMRETERRATEGAAR